MANLAYSPNKYNMIFKNNVQLYKDMGMHVFAGARLHS